MTKPGRRGNGEGTYVKHGDGRHEWRIPVADGKYRSVSDRSYKESIRKRNELRKEIERGLVSTGGQSVNAYLQEWLAAQQGQVKASTWRVYETQVRLHIGPHIGRTVLRELKAQQVQRMETTLLKTKSAATVRQTHAILHLALKDAHRMRLVADNVMNMFDAPRRTAGEMRCWSAEEARRFLAAARGHRLEALYILALTTGMRQGELLALRWQDIDVGRGTLHVARSVRFQGGRGYVFTEPKTKKSNRILHLSVGALSALEGHRARQAAEGQDVAPEALVFTTPSGGVIQASNLGRYATAGLMRAAGVPVIRFHDLRHTCATLLLSRKEHPKAVSELLGHADVATTLRIYAHVLPSMHAHIATAMQAVLFSESCAEDVQRPAGEVRDE